jgi:uncharacterized protein YaaR (DUF327 family)
MRGPRTGSDEMSEIRVSESTPIYRLGTAKPVERAKNDGFDFELNRLGADGLKERLDALVTEITAAGEKLAEHMDIRDMKQYRDLVADFINEVVTNSHKFSRENFLDRRGRHRVYGIVRLVNKGVDEIAQELLKKEKDHIKILDKADEIRGLLLDLTV